MAGKRKSVMVGMSGGVDSTVTALLLKQEGYEVVGVTFQLWSPEADKEEDGLNSAIRDAKGVCDDLDIPHFVFDYKTKFLTQVVEPFAQDYEEGRTPNPCVVCNKTIKFNDFLHRARGMGFDYIATGHYARIGKNSETGDFMLQEGVSKKRDQSYFLYNLSTQQLPYILMPLGEYDKPEIRKKASEFGFKVADRPDSQDICFIPDGDYVSFLNDFLETNSKMGDFVDTKGAVLGRHQGIRNYTIGQRKGLGVSFGKPMFVLDIKPDLNQVVLGGDQDLFSSSLVADQINWISPEPDYPAEMTARIRYAAQPALVTVTSLGEGRLQVDFKETQRAITPGQSVVFYHNDQVLGGGVILSSSN